MTKEDTILLRRIYGEICQGYSSIQWDKKNIYLKHLTPFDTTDIDEMHQNFIESACQRGIKNEEEKLAWLKEKGIWTGEDEKKIKEQQIYVDGLKTTKTKGFIKSQMEALEKQYQEAEEVLYKMINARSRLVGTTAEKVAEQKIQFEYIKKSFYKDKYFNEEFFSKSEINNLSGDESDNLLNLYILNSARFGGDSIKKIALQPFFLNYLALCGDNIFYFFNKPIVNLTLYQMNLLTFGLYYKKILSEYDIPDEISNNPNEIENFINRRQNFKNVMQKASAGDGKRVGIVGMQEGDFKDLNIKNDTSIIKDSIKKEYKNAAVAAKDLGFTYKN